MDGYKLNKFAGAVILAVLIIMGINEVNNALNIPDEPERQAYIIEGVEPEGGSHAEAEAVVEAAPAITLAMRLASADAVAGAKVFKKCTQCHTIEAGGRNLQGPNLHNVVGAAIGGKDFKYSKNVAAHGGDWTYENLDKWLKKPSDFISRTKMVQALKKDTDRANVILFLMQNTENPPALPVVDLALAAPAAPTTPEVEAPEAEALEGDTPEMEAPAIDTPEGEAEAVEEAVEG